MSLPRRVALGVTSLAVAFLASAGGGRAASRSAAPELASWAVRARQVAEGLRYLELRRGEVAGGVRLDVVVGSASKQAEADRLVWAVERAGYEPTVVYGSGRYEIRVADLAGAREAERVRAHLGARGLDVGRTVEVRHDLASAEGPWVAHVLEADPSTIDVRAAHARDASFGLETTSSIARRHGALAAVNGGFFLPDDDLAGDSAGTLAVGGRLLSEPDRGRATLGFLRRGGRLDALFGRPRFCAVATLASGDQIAIDGIDRRRGADEAILYTPEFHRSTLTGADGVEARIVDGTVVAVRRGLGGTPIPEPGFVLSLGPGRVEEDGSELRPGESVAIELRLAPSAGDPDTAWEGVESAVSAGPLLLAAGRAVGRPALESISQVFARARHPRTAVGERADGTILFVVVEGRMPERSVGMTLAELSALLLELGAVNAVNLDGGGSTAMVIGDELVSTPSDRGGERANGDALLLFPVAGPSVD